jgi:hypothetical protein
VWLRQEQDKLSGVLFKNPENNAKRLLNVRNPYHRLITESRRRLGNSKPYIPRKTNVKFSNNKNWFVNKNYNFTGLANGIPIILTTKNNRYLGHVWVNGTKAPNRSTGHFQGIQKTVNLNKQLTNAMKNKYKPSLPYIKFTPIMLNAAEKHLKGLGYKAMSTRSPLFKMTNYLNSHPNVWKKTGPSVYKKNLT